MLDGYLDACGVQNLFLEVDMAFEAFQDMWAGKKPEKLLLDPGFVITQDNLEEMRDQMWGYIVWTEERRQGLTPERAAPSRRPAIVSRAEPAEHGGVTARRRRGAGVAAVAAAAAAVRVSRAGC